MGHLHNGIVLNLKKKKILPPGTVWMDLENIMLSEINQSKTNTIQFHSYLESDEQTELTHKKDRLMDGEQMTARC